MPDPAQETVDASDAVAGPDTGAEHEGPGGSSPRSRRSLLAAAAAALGAVAAQSVASVAPVAAANGSTVKVGQTNTGTATTTVRNTASPAASTALQAVGTGSDAIALRGIADTGSAALGVLGHATSGYGVRGIGRYGVRGEGTTRGVNGVASASGGLGVYGQASSGYGVRGDGNGIGVYGAASAPGGTGVQGTASGNSAAWGVGGITTTGHGVHGESSTGDGVHGSGTGSGGIGVYGIGVNGVRGEGRDPNHTGVIGFGYYGTYGAGTNTGVYANGPLGLYASTSSFSGAAASFLGNVNVNGVLSKSSGAFLIDHPLDPANRYLAHSFVESPDMLNVYSGAARLNAKGKATVRLPRYFEALNKDHRVQLTPVGAPAPDLHLARKVDGNSFAIAGGRPGQEVFWQVTGVRQDAWANKHRIKVDTAKKAKDRGKFLNPEVHGARRSQGITFRKAATMSRRSKDDARKVTKKPLSAPAD
jgi:hypothetical protein